MPNLPDATYFERALAGSWFFVSAYSESELVGFTRIISDGYLHAFVTEMIVHPKFQKLGIGSRLLASAIEACKTAGISDIQLFSAKNKSKFYEAKGFKARPLDAPGMQYLPGT